ncbi:MAG: hypothetical protein KatS3mg001_250 [Candidatus Pacearchaeota archaeon]|nr:MAG: hypothetical protein KatS3mg001_250 [Candidatus Pacearchaeota archaeon]
MMSNSSRTILFIIFLLFGVYFLNYPLNFIKLPQLKETIKSWIIFIGGILIIVGGISFLKATRYSYY